MKGLKFLVTCAAVGALACTFAAASFADDYTTTANYDAEDGTVTIGDLTDYAALVKGDMTLLILATDNPNVIITSENTSIIKQIQQAATFDSAEIPVGELADGTYFVRIGGADTTVVDTGFIRTSFTVGGEEEIIYGDVDGSGEPGVSDTTAIFNYLNGELTLTATQQRAGDVDLSGEVGVSDTTAIFEYLAGSIASLPVSAN